MDSQEVIIPSTQKPKSNFLIIILILVSLFLTTSFLYFGYQLSIFQKQKLTPSPVPLKSPIIQRDETTGWQTYTNNQYNFEFKYPKKFILNETTTENSILSLQDSSNTEERLSTLPDISLRASSIPEGKKFEDILISDVVFDGSGGNPKSIDEFSSKKLGNNTVYYIETGRFEGILSTNYYIVRNNLIFSFVSTSSPIDWTNPNYKTENDQLNKNLQQIFSTLKFID